MDELYYFSKLKAAVLQKFCEAQPGWQRPLSAFGVREIAKFQEMLQQQAGGRISEKWFYTHLKPETNVKLPRIDVLDLLSRFAGHEDWAGFLAHDFNPGEPAVGASPAHDFNRGATAVGIPPAHEFKRGALGYKIIALFACGALGLFLFISLLGSLKAASKKSFEACFSDALTRQPLHADAGLEVRVLRQNESPLNERADSSACRTFHPESESVTFVARAKYYLPDTITRRLSTEIQRETFFLRRDDYALMIHLFSSGKVQDWQQRRQQLDRMIAADAMIFQVDEATNTGTELYNKEEFISKMSLPVAGLKNLRILETEYNGEGKIQALWFTQ